MINAENQVAKISKLHAFQRIGEEFPNTARYTRTRNELKCV